MDNLSKIKRNHSQKIIPLFANDSPQVQKTLKREILQKLSQCSSKCLNDVVTTSFEALTQRAVEYEKKEDSGLITSMGDNLIDGINKITEGMLTASNLVVLANCQMAVGHVLELMSELSSEDKVVAMFSMRERATYLGQLLIGLKANISLFRIKTGAIADNMWPSLTRSAGFCSDAKFFLNDKKDILAEEILEEVIRIKEVYGHLDLVIIDNLEDLMNNSGGGDGYINLLKAFRALADEQKLLVLIITQQDIVDYVNDAGESIEQSDLQRGICLYADFAYSLSMVKAHKGTVDLTYFNIKNRTSDKVSYFSKHLIDYASFNGLIGEEYE